MSTDLLMLYPSRRNTENGQHTAGEGKIHSDSLHQPTLCSRHR